MVSRLLFHPEIASESNFDLEEELGSTSLTLAAEEGHDLCIALLLEAGADGHA